ncbi:hypothetical protein [Pseudomonas brenneri]
MKFLSDLSQAAQRFGNRFSNRQMRIFAALLYVATLLMSRVIPPFLTTQLTVFAITLFVLSLGRRCPKNQGS